nr:DUF2330 domain-containing protein [Nannocystis sp.]
MKTAGLVAMLAAGGVALAPTQAEACGGTFCDGGVPGPMPVDQTGENVIFVLGDTDLEVHIQINIDPNTNAEQFGWLVPLAAVPEFSVGSQPLFNTLLSASVPTYGLNTTFESCGFGTDSGPFTSSGDPNGGDTGEAGTSGGVESEGGNPVVKEVQIGAFQIAVLQAATVETIKTWLLDNGYVWDENAAGILQQYLDEGNVIVALKLAAGQGVEDVHPITLTYPAVETCFPLRLTRIAAVEDMEIRVFVMADNRAAPTNYKHVLVNPLKIDWLNFGTNYKQVITNAVDAFGADGRAFVTEFAGAGPGANLSVYNPAWNQAAFVGLDPSLVVSKLNEQNLASCFDNFSCFFSHPLVLPLLLEFLPPPDGVEPLDFYGDMASYVGQIDLLKWNDGAEFSAALLARVIEPGMHADELLTTWPYLTRMYTTISPAEMMEDPIFHQNPDLAEVPNVRIAENYVLCNADSVVTLPDEREFYIPGGGPWPAIPDEEWFAEEVQTVALKGAPMTLVNNTAAINMKLKEWNLSHGWPRVPGDTDGPPTTSDTDAPTSGGTDGETGGTGGTGSTTDAATTGGQNDDSGCGCRSSTDPQGSLWLGLSALGLLGLRRRRS